MSLKNEWKKMVDVEKCARLSLQYSENACENFVEIEQLFQCYIVAKKTIT